MELTVSGTNNLCQAGALPSETTPRGGAARCSTLSELPSEVPPETLTLERRFITLTCLSSVGLHITAELIEPSHRITAVGAVVPPGNPIKPDYREREILLGAPPLPVLTSLPPYSTIPPCCSRIPAPRTDLLPILNLRSLPLPLPSLRDTIR